MLEQRATALKAGEFKEVLRVQDEMTAFKNKHLQELMRPRFAYVIFQDQRKFYDVLTKVECLNFNLQAPDGMKSFEINLNRAKDPSDIIW